MLIVFFNHEYVQEYHVKKKKNRIYNIQFF